MHASLRWILLALLVTLSACDSTSTDDSGADTDAFALTALTCEVEGINADPFTVADALADNADDHEAANDYTYDGTTATTIALAGTSATLSGSTLLETALSSTVTDVTL